PVGRAPGRVLPASAPVRRRVLADRAGRAPGRVVGRAGGGAAGAHAGDVARPVVVPAHAAGRHGARSPGDAGLRPRGRARGGGAAMGLMPGGAPAKAASEPRENRLLAALGLGECAELTPYLHAVELRHGTVLMRPGEPVGYVWFPHSAVVSLTALLADGGTT